MAHVAANIPGVRVLRCERGWTPGLAPRVGVLIVLDIGSWLGTVSGGKCHGIP
jgi:hypothetical protein